jgi:AmmeMemoRadiSam system protein A
MLPLTEADQKILLRLARQALEESVRESRFSDIEELSGALREPCGAFVTLNKGGHLRGCIGYIEPLKPLFAAVRECAMAAALRDPRFEPVTPNELPDLHVEISVLSPLVDIRPDQIEVGRHGLLVSRGAQRGLLLPQVAVEWKWDGKRFLEETCSKAGLPRDAWRKGARLQAFTAQVFQEPSQCGCSAPSAA